MRGAFSTALGQHSVVFRHLLLLERTDIEWNSNCKHDEGTVASATGNCKHLMGLRSTPDPDQCELRTHDIPDGETS